MSEDPWLTEAYFDWLRSECFQTHGEGKEFEGVLRLLHDVPFYWTLWSDENRVGDALTYRQYDFLDSQETDGLDQHWLNNWAHAAPSVLEVLLAISRRYSNFFEGPIQMYFGHLFHNLRMDRYPGRVLTGKAQQVVRQYVDNWMARQFQPNGTGSPFPLRFPTAIDYTKVDIWGQMNAYSAEHFQ